MTKNHILGMDIAQKSATVQLDRGDGTPCWRGTLSTDQTGWQQLEKLRLEHGVKWSETVVIIEATGVYHLAWAERLHREGAEVYVLNPLIASRLESIDNVLRGHKTDPVDAGKLCEITRLYAAKLARFRYQPDPARQGLKQLDHARGQLRATLTNLKKSFQSHLELVFPALLEAKIGPFTARADKILAKAPTAGAWGALSEAERETLAGDKRADLDQACANTLASEPLAQACVPALRNLLAAYQVIAAQLKSCDADITPRISSERVALIASVPGFGERTATAMTTYLPADIKSLGKTHKQITARIQALCGADPRLCTSGKWTGKIRISKRGIVSARTALFQAAFCSIPHDEEMAHYYEQLRKRGKAHKVAMVDLMRKQVRRLTAVLCSERPFVKKNQQAA